MVSDAVTHSLVVMSAVVCLGLFVLGIACKIPRVWRFFEKTALLWIAAGTFCIGMSGMFWYQANFKPLTYTIRILCIVSVVLLVIVHVRYWVRERTFAFRPEKAEVLDVPAFRPVSGPAAKHQYEAALSIVAEQFGLDSEDNMRCLLRQLLEPKPFRRRIHEKVRVEHRSILHSVALHMPAERLYAPPWHQRRKVSLISVAHPLKQDAYHDTSVVDHNGNRVEALNYRQAQSVVYSLLRQQVYQHRATLQSDIEAILVDVADIIASPKDENRLARRLYEGITQNPVDHQNMPTDDLWGLLNLAATRRPIIIAYRAAFDPELILSINSLRKLIDEFDIPNARENRWRWFGRKTRAIFGFSSTQLVIPVARARSCLTYRLSFSAPQGTYIQETAAYSPSAQKWLPNDLDSHGLYAAFVGWSEPDGRNECSLACRSFDATGLEDLVFYARVSERPPGTGGKAILVAFAAALVVWLCGALPLKQGVNVDVIALTLALPGVAAVWFGISGDIQPGSFRSIPALVSMGMSGIISVLSIIIYMGSASGHADGSPRIPATTWPADDTFFMVNGVVWSALLLLALSNLACIGASFFVSVHRYRSIVRGRLLRQNN
ncbi:hypothetical protein CG716_23090 [Mycolicibacterium sphagni]|uniref:Uncharacterized protein n=1 Tax=Mycolicibacterium sphagni TaxID=1786 RepID=A0A255DAV1_9MYCO|nr:hypothetical protein CG716_23090 [Mycolicibacterium sphagni]